MNQFHTFIAYLFKIHFNTIHVSSGLPVRCISLFSVETVFSWYIDSPRVKRLGFDCRQGQGTFLYSTESRPSPGPTQLSNQWVLGTLPPGVKRRGLNLTTSPSNAETKNGAAIRSLSHTFSWRGA
jgi:hypothetical protein